MADHQALYRKWRPQRFADVVNQTYAIQTLINALSSGEVGHAYLFSGPRGTGKTTVARLFARAVNCLNPQQGEPCNECDACQRISRGASLDVVEIDGASNRGIDQIRKLREEVNFVPADVKYKVYIIDEVHMLTNEAFNALLKTLEEPPKRVVFIFATTESHKLPPTVTSRCQSFEFTRFPPEVVATYLKHICENEGIKADERAINAIASRCGGAMRDALVTLEQVSAYAQGDDISGETLENVLGLPSESVLVDFLKALIEKDADSVLNTIRDLAGRGRDLELFLEELIRLGRDWLILAVAKKELPVETSVGDLAALTDHLLTFKNEMGRVWDKQIWMEVGMLQLIHGQPAVPVLAQTAPPAQQQPQQKTTQQPAARPTAKPAPPASNGNTVETKPQPSAEPTQSESEEKVETQPQVQPESQPAASPSASQEKAWDNLLEMIKDERVAIYAYLVEGHALFEDQRLLIRYHTDFHFHKESLESSAIQGYVLEKAKLVYGNDIKLDIDFFEEQPIQTAQANPSEASDSNSNPSVEDSAAAEVSTPPPPAPRGRISHLEEKMELVKKVLGTEPPAQTDQDAE